jgi:predicted metal-dependent hydrolase
VEQKIKQLSEQLGFPIIFVKSARNKRLVIRMRPFKPIRVSIPSRLPLEHAYKFVCENINQIKTKLNKIKALQENPIQQKIGALDDIDIPKSVKMLTERTKHLADKFGFKINRVCIRNQKTRWGSCSNIGNINLNIQLIRLEQEMIDYVIMHELVHRKVPNHSRIFWQELEKYIPNAKNKAAVIRKIRL